MFDYDDIEYELLDVYGIHEMLYEIHEIVKALRYEVEDRIAKGEYSQEAYEDYIGCLKDIERPVSYNLKKFSCENVAEMQKKLLREKELIAKDNKTPEEQKELNQLLLLR